MGVSACWGNVSAGRRMGTCRRWRDVYGRKACFRETRSAYDANNTQSSLRIRRPPIHVLSTRRPADTPTRRYVSPTRRHADTPTRRYVSPTRRHAERRPADTFPLPCFNSLEDINDFRGFFGISELIAQFVVAKNAHQSTDEA